MVTYRGIAKTNTVRMRDMISPHFKLEVKRESKVSLAQAVERFLKLLLENTPDSGATAWLEISDRYGPRTLVKYEGSRTISNQTSGAVIKGVWKRIGSDVSFPEKVDS